MSRDNLSVLARRWLLAALALVAVLTLAALLWAVAPWVPHTYLATQTLRIVVLPPDGGATYTAADAQDQENVIARDLASDALLSSTAFISNVLHALPPGARPGTIQHDLRVSHSENFVILTASAGSPADAATLANAAAHALSTIGAALPLPSGELDAASVRVDVGASPVSVVEDLASERAQASMVVAKGAFAALAILVVLAALVAAGTRRRGEDEARLPGLRASASAEQ
jgi:hypothetical protein